MTARHPQCPIPLGESGHKKNCEHNLRKAARAERLLHAAAPEMYALLNDMAELFETQNDADEEAWDKLFERCRAVIAKAEGET